MSRRAELERRFQELMDLKERLLATRGQAHAAVLARALKQVLADIEALREAYERLEDYAHDDQG